MRPTRRWAAAVGKTWASAARTSSIRAREFGMPRTWLPDMEPEASNTIMASSVQGEGLFSSALEAERVPVMRPTKAMITSRKLRFMASRLRAYFTTIAQISRKACRLYRKKRGCEGGFMPRPLLAEATWKGVSAFAFGAGVARGGVALEEIDHQARHVDAGRLLEPLDAWR